MAIDKVPSILDHKDFTVVPFEYSSDNDLFLVGPQKERIAPNEMRELFASDFSGMATKDMANLRAGFASSEWIFTGPSFFDFVESPNSEHAISETPEVMRDVFSRIHHSKANNVAKNDSHWGFNVKKLRSGHLTLNSLGDCACLGVGLYGFIRERDWDTKFAQYEFHNIDFEAQKISLLAGLGFIAGKVSLSN